MRKKLSYIFFIPGSILFFLAEKIRGEKVGWRLDAILRGQRMRCSKCGHEAVLGDVLL